MTTPDWWALKLSYPAGYTIVDPQVPMERYLERLVGEQKYWGQIGASDALNGNLKVFPTSQQAKESIEGTINRMVDPEFRNHLTAKQCQRIDNWLGRLQVYIIIENRGSYNRGSFQLVPLAKVV